MIREKRLPKSIRSFIRREKSRIREMAFDAKKQEELISDIYKKLFGPKDIVEKVEKKEPVAVKTKTKLKTLKNQKHETKHNKT